jgi:uncharacterized membrane protein AbrB (regulator of aidB expression)
VKFPSLFVILVAVLFATMVALWLLGREVPDLLVAVALLLLGYVIGTGQGRVVVEAQDEVGPVYIPEPDLAKPR